MRNTIKIITALVIIFCLSAVPARADLLEQYLNNDRTPTRGEMSYGFGVNIPAPYESGGGGDLVNLSAGIEKKGSCGSFNIAAELKGIFSKEVLDQYVSGLLNSITSGAPMLILCYASQTLCDLYKHFRNMANAALKLRHAQCSQIEALAANAGTSLRNNAIKKCIDEKLSSGDSLDIAMSACGRIDPEITIPGSAQKVAEYSLSDAIAKAGSDDPEIQKFIKGVIGDVRFSGNSGIYTVNKMKYAMETEVSNLTNAYYNAFKDVGEQYVSSGSMPDRNALRLISTPGNPVTPLMLTKLSFLDPVTRDSFYRQYASVAAMDAMLYKVEDAIEALEKAKAASQDKDTIAKLEESAKDLQRRYDIMEKRLALQKDYLLPMMQTLMAAQASGKEPATTSAERKSILPKGIVRQ